VRKETVKNILKLRKSVVDKLAFEMPQLHFEIDRKLPVTESFSLPPSVESKAVKDMLVKHDMYVSAVIRIDEKSMPELKSEHAALKTAIEQDEQRLHRTQPIKIKLDPDEREREGHDAAMANARVTTFRRHQEQKAIQSGADWSEYQREQREWIDDYIARDDKHLEYQQNSIRRTNRNLQAVRFLMDAAALIL
jgi:hypothetical protein